jgi:hypothetical protein
MSGVIGSASTVRSTKRTAEVILERLAVAEEGKEQRRFVRSDSGRHKGSPLTTTTPLFKTASTRSR